MLRRLLHLLRHDNHQVEATKKKCAREWEETREHVNRLKQELQDLNGRKRRSSGQGSA